MRSLEADFEIGRMPWTARATEAARRYRITTPVLPGQPPCATPPILKGWHHAATDRGVACCGAAASAEGEGGGWRE